MKEKIKKWLKPVLFTAGGALVGLAYYYFVGCPTGACPLTSNPFITMAYMGFIGWLLSGIFGKGCSGSCNTQWLIARFKRSHWDFQQEFRYIVILQRARNNIPLKPYYDADLDDAAISNMRIVVSRLCDVSDVKTTGNPPSHSRTKTRRIGDAGTRESKAPAASSAGGRLSAGSQQSIGF